MSSDLTDVRGVRVGHWSDPYGRTGCTVVLLPPGGAVTSVDVRGAAPGTRETDLLAVENSVHSAHAILLAGGSAFGLAAADGVMRRLEQLEVGYPAPAGPVPIVPAAVIYDLAYGSATARPVAEAGWAATLDAERGAPCGSGRIGAGTGATVGKLLGMERAEPGGLGTASRSLPGGGIVGAVAVVNAVGDVIDRDGSVLAGPGTVAALLGEAGPLAAPLPSTLPSPGVSPGVNTTLVVVVTDLTLTKAQCRRLAVVAHDGLARSIEPVHTSYDGDTVFASSTGGLPAPTSTVALETVAVDVVATAVRRAVLP